MSVETHFPSSLEPMLKLCVGKRNNPRFYWDWFLSAPWKNETDKDEFVRKDCKNGEV